jgi:hypothetical protein
MLIGPGSSPFWLDNDTFGYVIIQGQELSQSVVIQDVLTGGAETHNPAPLIVRTAFGQNAQPPTVKGGS